MTECPAGLTATALRSAGVGALAAGVCEQLLRIGPPSLQRRNYRGRPVSLAGGPALVLAIAGVAALDERDLRTAALATVVGGVGFLDDLSSGSHARGFAGHARALRSGTVTTGTVKVIAETAAAWVLAPRRPDERAGKRLAGRALATGVIASAANLINLLDLRPGRALKVVAAGAVLVSPELNDPTARGVLTASIALLPHDLGERVMIGDCGANAAGAVLGSLAVKHLSPRSLAALALVLVALNLASERVSFTSVIESNGLLSRLDHLGRRD